MELERTRDRCAGCPGDVDELPGPEDSHWPGILMVVLILAAFWSPLVTSAAGAVAWLIADREQAILLAAVGAALLLLS